MDRATLVIDGVEITPAMVDAGVRVLHASGLERCEVCWNRFGIPKSAVI